jgi:hypothetical protein
MSNLGQARHIIKYLRQKSMNHENCSCRYAYDIAAAQLEFQLAMAKEDPESGRQIVLSGAEPSKSVFARIKSLLSQGARKAHV